MSTRTHPRRAFCYPLAPALHPVPSFSLPSHGRKHMGAGMSSCNTLRPCWFTHPDAGAVTQLHRTRTQRIALLSPPTHRRHHHRRCQRYQRYRHHQYYRHHRRCYLRTAMRPLSCYRMLPSRLLQNAAGSCRHPSARRGPHCSPTVPFECDDVTKRSKRGGRQQEAIAAGYRTQGDNDGVRCRRGDEAPRQCPRAESR